MWFVVMLFSIFKDDGVTNGRTTNGIGATDESECGGFFFRLFSSVIQLLSNVMWIVQNEWALYVDSETLICTIHK